MCSYVDEFLAGDIQVQQVVSTATRYIASIACILVGSVRYERMVFVAVYLYWSSMVLMTNRCPSRTASSCTRPLPSPSSCW